MSNPFQAPMSLGVGGDRYVLFQGGASPIALLADGTMCKFECGNQGYVRAVIGGNVVGTYKIAGGRIVSKNVEARYEQKLEAIVTRSAAFSPGFPDGRLPQPKWLGGYSSP